MIAKITLENFFSFGDPTTIELNSGINLLLGINGSGKSNMLKAINLLYHGVVGDGFEKVFLKDWGGFNSVGNFTQRQKDYIKLTFEFDCEAITASVGTNGYQFTSNPSYEITIFRSGASAYYLEERIHSHYIFSYMDMKNTKGSILNMEEGQLNYQLYPQEEKSIAFKSTELVLRQLSDPDRYYALFTLKRALETLAVYDYFDTTLKSAIRQPSPYDIAERLLPNGQNLMSILNNIKNHHSLEYEKIERAIQKINPNFKDINFDIVGSKLFLVLREKHLSRSVSIEHISDGSLRYLLLLSMTHNPARGAVLCIDEPEIGLHPDMISSIAETFKAASKDNTQLIIPTHSPLLLNLFELDEVLVFEKNASNQTIVNRKSEEDFEDWNENYLAGQLWLSGLIGGKRW